MLEEAWARADAVDHAFAAFHLASYRGGWAFGLADIETAAAWFERELAKPRMAQALRPRRSILAMLTEIKVLQGDSRAARAAADESNLPGVVPAILAFQAGDWDEACAAAIEFRDRVARAGARWQQGYSSLWLGKAAFAGGDREAGERALRESIEVAGLSSANTLVSRVALGVRLAVGGAAAAAEAELRCCREVMDNGEDWGGTVGRMAVLEAAVAAARGEQARAEAAARQAVDTLHRHGAHFDEAGALRVWGWCLRQLGDEAAAADREGRARALLREQGVGEPWVADDVSPFVLP